VLALSGTYLRREGVPASVMKAAANNPAAYPLPVKTSVVRIRNSRFLEHTAHELVSVAGGHYPGASFAPRSFFTVKAGNPRSAAKACSWARARLAS